jgi:CubicO group peptidase (beta-lactamase class C family)
LALAVSASLGLSASWTRAQTPDASTAPAASDSAAAAASPSSEVAQTPRVAPVSAPSARESPRARLSAGTPIPPAELEALVDGVVRASMARDHIAGVTVSVVQNGQVVLKKGYGFAGPNRAVDPDQTLFRIGAISTTFTWIALMKEVEAGHIRLTEPINLYLPETLQVRDQGYKRLVLVRDLPTHTPGFEDRALGQLFEQKPSLIRPLADYLRQERPRRVREASVWPSYSYYGAALAGEAVSYVNGHPYQDVVDSEIIHPLGLAHTTLREPYPPRQDLPAPMPADLAGAVSIGYRWTAGGFAPQSFEFATQIAPALAGSSTASDMARYMLMILGGGQLDGAAIYGPGAAAGFRTTLQAAAPGVGGLDNGFMEVALPGGFIGRGQDGDTLWFHSSMITVPELDLGLFVATNTDTGTHLTAQLSQRIVGQFYATPQDLPSPGSPALAAERGVYAGTYLTTRRAYHGLERFVDLIVGQTRIVVTEDGRLLAGAHSWIPSGAEGQFQETDGPLKTAFALENGRAVRWFPPSGATTFERIGPLYQIPTLVVITIAALLAAIATLVGIFTRDRRESRQTPMQSRAGLVQSTIAVLWLISTVFAAVWAYGSPDRGQVMYHWPGPWLILASACALTAALLTLLTIIMAPSVWRGGRRVDSWTGWRKLRFTMTTLIFAALSLMLGLWGALAPWSA